MHTLYSLLCDAFYYNRFVSCSVFVNWKSLPERENVHCTCFKKGRFYKDIIQTQAWYQWQDDRMKFNKIRKNCLLPTHKNETENKLWTIILNYNTFWVQTNCPHCYWYAYYKMRTMCFKTIFWNYSTRHQGKVSKKNIPGTRSKHFKTGTFPEKNCFGGFFRRENW